MKSRGAVKKNHSEPGLSVEQVSLESLVPAPYNPRKIKTGNLKALAAELQAFGFVEPLVANRRKDGSLVVVGGHQRLKAALSLGWKAAPVSIIEVDEKREKSINLALNNTNLQGEWDKDLIGGLLSGIGPVEAGLAGFDSDDLYGFGVEDTTADHDEATRPEPPEHPRTKAGEIVRLGSHRLMCGDSGNPEHLDALMGGEPIHLLNTDPPYNVRVEPRSNNAIASGLTSTKGNVPARQRAAMHHQALDLARRPGACTPTTKRMRAKDRALQNDFLPPAEFEAKLRSWFANAARVMRPGAAFYIWAGYSNIANMPSALVEAGLYFSQAVIWFKEWPVLTRKDFMGNHEWAFYGWKDGGAHYFNPKVKNETDVWKVRKIPPVQMKHLTEKPVELARRAIHLSSRPGENVLDLFGGSGSTLIAAERMGRRAFLMEIDPAYCDVIRDWYAAIKTPAPGKAGCQKDLDDFKRNARTAAVRKRILRGEARVGSLYASLDRAVVETG